MPASVVSSLVWIFFGVLAAGTVFGDEPAKKAAPPDASAQAEATKLIKEVYGREVAAAKTADQKKALAEKLFQMAKENDKDLSAQFALLKLSRDIAAQASDCQTAFAAIEIADKVFQIDALDMKAEALRKCAAAAITIDQHMAVAKRAAAVADDAVATGNFTLAKPLMELALGEAKKAKDDPLLKRVAERKAEVEETAKDFAAVKKAMATLEKVPADPDANLMAGKYACFIKGDWEHGLPMLALGNDPVLKALSEAEAKGVASSEQQAKLGDSWWDAAEAQRGMEKKQMQLRAISWYDKSLPALAGLPRERALSRLRKFQVSLVVYLADLPADEVRVIAEGGPARTTFKGKLSPHTLWAHPPEQNSSSHLAYPLDGRFNTLRGDAGIGSGGKLPPATPLTFRIIGDGQTLWESKPSQERDTSAAFRVSVKDVKKLELFVDCPGRYEYAFALWIDPVLER